MKETLIINRRRRGPYYRMDEAHSHDAYEIYYLVFGNRRFFINDTIYYIKPGDLVVIPKGEIHRTSFDSDSTHERVYVYFSEDYLADLFERYGRMTVLECFSSPQIPVPANRRGYLENLFRRMEAEYEHGDKFSDQLLRSYLAELLFFILRCRDYHSQTGGREITGGDARMQEAARYVAREFRQELTLESVAAFMGLSAPYFSRKFKEATGFGFREYLVHVRIRNATALLLETQKSVTQIAYECGFNDSNYFGDVFKRVKGLSPLRYRKGKGNFA